MIQTYQLGDILRHVQDYLHDCSVHNLLNAVPLRFRANINCASSSNCNLVSRLMAKKVLFATVSLACDILHDGFETIPGGAVKIKILFETKYCVLIIWYENFVSSHFF